MKHRFCLTVSSNTHLTIITLIQVLQRVLILIKCQAIHDVNVYTNAKHYVCIMYHSKEQTKTHKVTYNESYYMYMTLNF